MRLEVPSSALCILMLNFREVLGSQSLSGPIFEVIKLDEGLAKLILMQVEVGEQIRRLSVERWTGPVN